MKHTKEWSILGDTNFDATPETRENTCLRSIHEGGRYICKLITHFENGTYPIEQEEQDRKDAQLIASAHELLEALKYIRDNANSKIIRGIAQKAIQSAEK